MAIRCPNREWLWPRRWVVSVVETGDTCGGRKPHVCSGAQDSGPVVFQKDP